MSEPVDEMFSEATEQLPDNNEVERKRSELISWIKQGNKLSKTIKQLEKSLPNVIEKVYDEWMTERNEKASAALCDLVISKFALLLGGLDAIEDPKTLEEQLKSDELLRTDIERMTMSIAPYIPLIGILSGGLTILNVVHTHRNNKISDEDAKKE